MRREERRSGVVFTGMTVLETLECSPLGGEAAGGGGYGDHSRWRHQLAASAVGQAGEPWPGILC